MPRSIVVYLLVLGLLVPGCVTSPPSPAIFKQPAANPPSVIHLCGHRVSSESDAVRAEVLRYVSPGLPVETAQARLEELGFRGLYGDMVKKKPASYHPTRSLPELVVGRDPQKDKNFHSLVCRISGKEYGNWGQYSFPIRVTLPYDEAGIITEVEVTCLPRKTSRYAALLMDRLGPQGPIGMPVEQARTLMEARKFHCSDRNLQSPGTDRQPYLDCYAYDEHPLGGNIVRVHLFYDQSRTVTEAEVVEKPGTFDDLRCMLPNNSDTVTGGILKTIVFPVRLYTAIVVAGLIADLSLGRP
jgi:hypothetical protein